MNLFKSIFPDEFFSNLPKFEYEVEKIILMTIIGISLNKLTSKENFSLENNIKEGKLDEAIMLLKTKYSRVEWEDLLDKEIKPLIASYIEDVVFPKSFPK